MALRKGKTKDILNSSIDSALLAVEIYNKPRTTFRVEAYITMMIIAWTKLFHAYFNKNKGNVYYYKNESGRFKRQDGERRAWELATCLKEYDNDLSDGIKSNLGLFIKLRNKISHRHIDKKELDILLFGECQALLCNYEDVLVRMFGSKYSLNESLAFSLQFSSMREDHQLQANKKALSSEYKEIKSFIDNYRTGLSDEIYNSQEFSIKLIQIPKISNTERNDIAIEFIKLDNLSDEQKKEYQKFIVGIKDKVSIKRAINPASIKPGDIVKKIQDSGIEFNHYNHICFYTVFKIRPQGDSVDPFNTNEEFCHYDEAHNDYLYQECWAEFIIDCLSKVRITLQTIKEKYKNNKTLSIDTYRS